MNPETSPDADFYDAELRRHNVHSRAAANVRPGDHVLDIGCGTGETTRDAGRAAVSGSAFGCGHPRTPCSNGPGGSPKPRACATSPTSTATPNPHHYSPAHFDVCISRFGTIFFNDSVDGFTNIGQALRPGGRLTLLVWQHPDLNEWSTAPRRVGSKPPVPSGSDSEPFSLADPTSTRRILTSAGFAEIGCTAVHEPVYYGANPDAAYDAVPRLRHASDLLSRLDVATGAGRFESECL